MNTANRVPEADLGGVPVRTHDHLCVLHRGRRERDRLLLPFLRDGLRAGQPCLCLTADGECPDLSALVVEPGLDAGLLETVDPHETYLRSGAFEPERMLGLLWDWSEQAFGGTAPRTARVIGDMSWIRPPTSPAFPADLLSYEARVTGWLRAYPLIGVCMYDVDVFDGRVVIPVVKGHPKVWLDGQLIDNPYHLRPEQYEAASSVAHELLREVD